MKIGFDIRPITVKGNGIANYTSMIYDKFLEKNDGKYVFIEGPVDITHSWKDKMKFYIWNQIKLPYRLWKEKFHLYHATKELEMPFIKTCKYITTIHDVIPQVFPKTYYSSTIKWVLFYKLKLWIAIKRSDIIITDSEFSKGDIIKYFKVDPTRIKVVYICADKKFKMVSKDEIIKTKEKIGLSKEDKYILGIGANEFRKNSNRLIEAYEAYIKECNSSTKLVVIGKSWRSMDGYVNSKNILFTGYVTDEDLVSLYNGAQVFVYPSLYEGFGLPPLEAMACGTPVITSSTTSIPEVVGNAALLVNPESVTEIKECLVKIENDEKLRSTMIVKGFEQAAKFTAEKVVGEIEKIYSLL